MSQDIPDDPNAPDAESTRSDTFRSLLRVVVLVLLMLLAVAGIKSWRDLSVARAHETDLQERIDATGQSILVLEERIERIRSDPAMLEELARDELGWVRDGDLVIVLPDE